MSIFSHMRKHAVVSTIIGLAVIIIAIIGGRAATHKTPAANTSGIKQVTLVNAATFRKGNLSVSANGTVQSYSQADLRSQMSAPVATINVSIGQSVYQGKVLMELQNSDIRAQLAQAEGALAIARGQLATGAVSLDSAKQAAIDKIHDAYVKTYDAIITQVEPILYNYDGKGGQLISFSSDTALNGEITSTYIDFKNNGFRDWKSTSDALTANAAVDAIEAVIKQSQKNMKAADLLLSDMSKVFNNLATYTYIPASFTTAVNTWKATVSAAQASVSGATQALTAAEMALNTAGTSQNSIAQAQVSVAQAGVSNLQAQLAKTIIRSPITGKISALPLRVGELASPGALLATVVGSSNGLEVKAFVSGEDLSKIKVGDAITIQNQTLQSDSNTQSTIKGVISNIAPSVDPTTKKAEVDITISDPQRSGLVIGQNVSVSTAPATSNTETNEPVTYMLPIQDVKIIPGSAYVFTVDKDSKVKRNDIIIAAIQGDFIEVKSGITDDMNIITPVYELDEGQTVRVEQ